MPRIICILALIPIFTQIAAAQDHGRVLSCALDVYPHKLKDTTDLKDTKNYVFRGKVISLGKDKKVSICYDVEHMRVAGAWVGKPMAWSADKNMGPTVEGEMLFSTKPGPGWAKDGKWADPRIGKEGPLPRDWAHYKGLYVHGDKVVLSYSVGDMDVLEMPEMHTSTVMLRRIHLGPTKSEQRMAICRTGGWKVKISKLLNLAEVSRGKAELAFGAYGQRDDPCHIENVDDLLQLRFPASDHARTFFVLHVWTPDEIPKGETPKIADVDVTEFAKGGPARWTETIETAVTLGDNKTGPYTLDQIALPEKNPWNASIRFAGLDFFDDGRAALCTWDGDVWIVEGLDRAGQKPAAKLKWKRFAAGLQQPLGLKIINGYIYTAGRDQITKLHDLNGDGEADFYENFNNDAGLTLQRHEFVMDLQTDKDGNLYYCRSGHYLQSKRGDNCVVYKVSPDGKKLEKFAKGFREPNGLSIGEGGVMTIADNEGNGIPQTPIYRLLPGKDYGFTPSTTGKVNDGSWKMLQQPIVWLGPKVDTSAGTQVWVPVGVPPSGGKDRLKPELQLWGPLAGKLLHTSYGNCALFHVMIDKDAEPWQGCVWKFPLTFSSGIMRARFNPKDGQLYVCGLRGWGTSAVKDGQLARVRYTGKDVPIPVGYRVSRAGLEFTFSGPLDKAAAEDDENWAGSWSEALKKTPSPKELREMPITAVRLSADRKTVTIAVDKLRGVPDFALQYRIKAADGAKIAGELNGTIHRVP